MTQPAGPPPTTAVAAGPPRSTTIRDAHSDDLSAVTALVAHGFAASATGRWLDPNTTGRRSYALRHAGTVTDDAFTHGTVRVADADGTPVAAALWVRCPAAERPDGSPPGVPAQDSPNSEAQHRARQLDRLLASRHHVGHAHEHLTSLAVHQDWQHSGLRAYLLTDHHHTLAQLGLPAYIDTDDPVLRQWCHEHGYLDRDIGDPITLPDGHTRIWPMRRAPTPVDNCTL